ncbi:Phytochrome-like protein cph2 [Vibrio aerogenes CECT 7868]|uniref:Phytochrome-like protein cph2 n=1 Tax=Vibrio aerogenes CECT 7868 TaxID=1216006 RepID=A0A1M6A3T0_9VIBR|nr:EAL domain-containing protein [Vibrio aerogenes]SHI31106.1 Phytochrome-like protein cph2 [Vibrio aerogenes CECT 7868]
MQDNSEETQTLEPIQQLDNTYINRLIHIFDVCNEGIFYMNHDGLMTFYNPDFYKQFDIESPTINISQWYHLVHPEDRSLLTARVDCHLNMPEQRMITHYRILNKEGRYVWVEGSAVCRREQCKSYIVGSHRDISDKKMLETYLKEAAFYDDYSGLFNLRKLLLDIDLIIREPRILFSVLTIQVGNFQAHADEYGSSDLMENVLTNIKAAAAVFHQQSDAVLYRINLNTFAVLIKHTVSLSELGRLSAHFIKHYRTCMKKQSNLLADTVNIGVYPNCDPHFDSHEILSIASRTCAFACDKSQSQIEFYEGETQKKVDRYFFIESGLKEALKNKALSVKFQPIIATETGKVSSFETLVRWHSHLYGDIYPDEFIPIAEDKGLISELGYQVFEKACQFLNHYNLKNQSDICINVNVSVLQLLSRNFPGKLLKIASEAQVKPSSIILEFTETVILDNNINAATQIKRLGELGFILSLDDFGSGFSSINSFFDLPFHQIKIDRFFARKSTQNQTSFRFLEFLIQLCHETEISIVIEGIETPEMLHQFHEMGASHLQGYWFSKPLSIANAMYYNPTNMLQNRITEP